MFEAGRVLRMAMRRDTLYGDLFFERKDYTQIHLESGRLEKVEEAHDSGTGIRIIVPWKTFYASTNALDEKNLMDIARNLGSASGGTGHFLLPSTEFMSGVYDFSIGIDPRSVGLREKVDLVRGLEAMIRKMEKRVKQVRAIYRDSCQFVRIENSLGVTVEDTRTQVVVSLLIVGEKNGDVQTAYEAIGGFSGFDFFTGERIEEVATKTVKRLAGLLDAVEAPMGKKTVVLASEAGGTMIHEAIGHGLEADLALEGLSCYKEKIGEHIASPLIDIVDDATVPNLRGTYAYDDEGVAAERTVLVEKGVLGRYLVDRFHGLKHAIPPTGNGRRESYRHRPIPRMSNTMILPGEDDPAAIIRSVDDGVLVVKMGGGQVDTVRGDFVFEISEGYLIEKGIVGPMIKNATMMGNGLTILREIDMVGSDLGIGIGTCGKDGQGVPVADGQPTLRIPEIIVGGKEKG